MIKNMELFLILKKYFTENQKKHISLPARLGYWTCYQVCTHYLSII
jgi:hypothetical protein